MLVQARYLDILQYPIVFLIFIFLVAVVTFGVDPNTVNEDVGIMEPAIILIGDIERDVIVR